MSIFKRNQSQKVSNLKKQYLFSHIEKVNLVQQLLLRTLSGHLK